ncbi:hypothetical protein PVAND_017197 [Polypedilum vanderplanki]|uniref:OBP47-like domain-containing protein n=1 Tax=Polypedilum vanderplanki TaxID=319348 RepID=A0A9J6BHL7_POLVA|nr:hypothetical protein PVAND_017197 [Polypedilum vanderplanki]
MKIWILLILGVLISDFELINSEGSEETTETATVEETTAAAEETTEVVTEEPTTQDSETSIIETETEKSSSSGEKSKTKAPATKSSPKSSQPDDSCTPWPSNLKSVRDCCNIPHNPASISLNTCFYRCSSREIDERRQVECAASCFVNVTGILLDDRLNRDRVKNLFIGTMMSNERWTRIIENAVDKCDLNSKNSLHAALARFFACINDYMAQNCVQFVQSTECEKTQDLFESCNHVKSNCNIWPVNLPNPEVCCRIPPLFSQKLVEKCRYECEHKELFAQRQLKCNEACLYNDTKLRNDGRFNFDVVKDLLMNSANFLPEWRKPISDAVDKCRTYISYQHDPAVSNHHPSTMGVNYEITILQTCLRDHLANDCVEFKDEGYCKRVKNFAKKCPETRPRKVVHYQYQYQDVRVQHG